MRVSGLVPSPSSLATAPSRPVSALVALLENRYAREGFLLLLGYAAYMLLRQIFPENLEAVGRVNASRIIEVEKVLGIYWEPTIQSSLLSEASWVVTFFNWAYSLGFLPVLVPGALVLMTLRYDTFVYFRRVFLISYVMTWALWLTVPVTPPRLMPELGFIDSIDVMGPAFYSSKEAIAFYNQHSAMPSMHFGWTLLFSVMLLRSGSRTLRLFGVLYPAAAFGAIVVTANHYFLDAVVGGVIVGCAFAIYHLAQRPSKEQRSIVDQRDRLTLESDISL